jgi:phosphate-selective porin
MNTNVKFMAYYDIVTNETSQNLSAFAKDLKDNVLTLRLQYKF